MCRVENEGREKSPTIKFGNYSHIKRDDQQGLVAAMIRDINRSTAAETWSLERNFLSDMTSAIPDWNYNNVIMEEFKRGADMAEYFGLPPFAKYCDADEDGGMSSIEENGEEEEGEDESSSSSYEDAREENDMIYTEEEKEKKTVDVDEAEEEAKKNSVSPSTEADEDSVGSADSSPVER